MKRILYKHRHTAKAFTLVESMIVLSVCTFMMSLFSSGLDQTLHVVRGELFVAEFEDTYKSTQLRASALRQSQVFSVSQRVLQAGDEQITIPEEVNISNFQIFFDQYGNNSSLSKLSLSLPYESKKISYQLEMGSGKYRKSEE